MMRYRNLSGSACLALLCLTAAAKGGSGDPHSPTTNHVPADRVAPVQVVAESCVLTLGFWKNHPRLWPLDAVSLGTVTYSQSQLLEILEESPHGNGLVILAHQLIAAKLNIASGAEQTVIAPIVAEADALIDGLVVPPIGVGSLEPRSSSTLAAYLDAYNNGRLGIQHCEGVAVDRTSWSGVRRLYRGPTR